MLINFANLYEKYNMNIKGVLHIGAHYGEEVKDYINYKIQNLVFFEPLSKSLEILEENLSAYANQANIQIFPYALGNEEKDVEMYVSDHGGMCSSVLKPKIVLEQYPGIKFPSKETVKMIKLDDAEIDIADYNFMNIDVQGYELEVFKGAKETLKNIDAIISEVNRAEVYENCPMVEELDEFLAPYGFKRVETSWDGHTWGDALYIKK